MSEVSLGHIFERVTKWNALRYEREYDHKLSVDLLTEEIGEFFEATTNVDRLDALCDIVYVSMGILWKISVDNETLMFNAAESHRQTADLLKTNTFEPVYFTTSVLFQYNFDNDYPAALAAQMMITLCMTQMAAMGLGNHEALMSLSIVCDSNDSKSVKKTATHVKANAGDKGDNFIAPEVKLQKVLNGVEARHGH